MTEDQQAFYYWINERESIRKKKEAGEPKPWTKDKILQTYKFCNVDREDDRVTKWIKDNWREPYRGHPNMWFAMIVARLFNWPDTLEKLEFPRENFNNLKEKWRAVLKFRRDTAKEKVFTGAYLVSTNGVKMDKIDYILDCVLTPIWERGCSPEHLCQQTHDCNLESYWKFLTQFDGLGSFMAGQVVADLKYVDPILENAEDWYSFAPLGPGSIRGLNRYAGRPVNTSVKQSKGLEEINFLRNRIIQEVGLTLPAHNVQNCLCEYDKYLRITKGEGKTRSTYPGV